MSIRSELTLALLLAMGLLIAAFASSAHAAGGYEQVNFKATVKGVQTFTEEYHHESTDRCDGSIDSSTMETTRFKSTKPVKLTATSIPKVKELVFSSGLKPLRIPTKATVKRSHSYSYGGVAADCPDNGGGVGEVTAPDCGARVIKPLWLSVDYYKPGHIELQPEDNAGSDPFDHCGTGKFPFILSGESFGKRSSAELPEKEVFDEKIGKLITIGGGNHGIVGPEASENTKIRWELSLSRIKDRK